MAKNVTKIITAIMIIALVMLSFSTITLGTVNFGDIDANTTINGASDTSGAAKSVQNIIQAILTVTQVVGVGVAVIMLIVLAIKYISAAPGDKAEIKKHAVVYVVGAVVLFAAAGILQIIKNFAGNVKPA